ncbi:hypothetical protein EVAR_67884_1 [Eumeta japonica]|uniref:Uncharacterized protein n=1 Tax=Eumeta variegata TaxID=151549 RepID=A0A4C2A6G3_EUMVA|nr:hypothetical protein EVAR_67884_1 [Eumeta japonica]
MTKKYISVYDATVATSCHRLHLHRSLYQCQRPLLRQRPLLLQRPLQREHPLQPQSPLLRQRLLMHLHLYLRLGPLCSGRDDVLQPKFINNLDRNIAPLSAFAPIAIPMTESALAP